MPKTRVLVVHNSYRLPGGEDVVFIAEKELLLAHGHDVIELTDTNTRLPELRKFAVARNAIWSSAAARKAEALIAEKQPDLVHVHNTWMLLSPSIYSVFQKERIPVVQTLHNYRLLCPNALFYRDNRVCEDCMAYPVPIPGILHKCYRNSASQSALVAAMLTYHRARRTWQKEVDGYIVLSEFARRKFIEGGLPAAKLFVKPNFVSRVPVPIPVHPSGDFALFVGRLTPEKGLDVLLNAWKSLAQIPLKIIGDGPLRDQVDSYANNHAGVIVLGHISRDLVFNWMVGARFLVFTSSWYEGFPMTIVEAFSCGLPVIAPRFGGIPEIVRDAETGLLFTAGDMSDLAEKVRWLWDHPELSAAMGREARREYEEKYMPERNYEMLMDIYHRVIENRKKQ